MPRSLRRPSFREGRRRFPGRPIPKRPSVSEEPRLDLVIEQIRGS
ncbi:hypothetical protein HMPREF9586_01561 [Cutibacterium acnes HL083PA2]|nr:hypothetical protein HMPREF9586_01561 [Cutibacterium acnes HL083PA2]